MAGSPKKRNARKKCAEAANVFAVRIGNSCFGHTDGFAAVVDPAPVDPTVASVGVSKRAQVDVLSVDVYHRAAPRDCRTQIILGRVHEPIHVLRPALIIEAHGHAKVVCALVNAQIGNLVAHLSDPIAEASQNHRRNPRYPEIPQPPKRAHISCFPPVESWCRDDWRFTPDTTRRSDSECAIESEIGSQPHKFLLSEN